MEQPRERSDGDVPGSNSELAEGTSDQSAGAGDADPNGRDFNRVQVLYNNGHPPFMYGLINVVDGIVENQRNHGPFLISKRLADEDKVVFGTVSGVIDKIAAQFDRFGPLNREFERALAAAGIEVDPADPVLPPGAELDALMDKQDQLIEEVLLTTSIYFRTLFGLFHNSLARFRVAVCDYNSDPVGELDLKSIGDLMAHNRFITVHNQHVIDLISVNEFMGESPQMGLKFDFRDYRTKMAEAVKSLTVKDLVGVLRGMIKRLSAASSPGDIVFVTQNLTALESLITRDGQPMGLTSIQSILDRLIRDDLDARKERGTLPTDAEMHFAYPFRGPYFSLEPDLNDKKIRTAITVLGRQEATITHHELFFEDIVRTSGDTPLYHDTTIRSQ